MRWLLWVFLLAGCRQILGFENPSVVPSDGAPLPDGTDAPIGCSGTPDTCPADVPICFGGICVECTTADTSACPVGEPFCGLDNQCRGCISNSDCTDSNLCLASGVCAVATDVAYVSGAGTANTTCQQLAPCNRVELGFQTGRPYIQVTGVVTDTMSVNLNRDVEIYGTPGAAISRSTNGQIFDTNNSANVRFFGIILRDATSTGGDAIRANSGSLLIDASLIANNGGTGVVGKGATITLRRSILFGNVEGGARIENSGFTITNCIIAANGSSSSSVGGIRIKPLGLPKVFELNTVADNAVDAISGNASGVECDQAFEGHSNIVAGNTLGNDCTFHDSLFTAATPGSNNRVGDPKFLTKLDPTALDFYRIDSGSPAIGGAVSSILFDIDGQSRPQGSGPDMGADERD